MCQGAPRILDAPLIHQQCQIRLRAPMDNAVFKSIQPAYRIHFHAGIVQTQRQFGIRSYTVFICFVPALCKRGLSYANLQAPLENRCSDMFAFPHFLRKLTDKLVFFQGIIELVRFIISQENVRSKRLKILHTLNLKQRRYCLFWICSLFCSFRKTKEATTVSYAYVLDR